MPMGTKFVALTLGLLLSACAQSTGELRTLGGLARSDTNFVASPGRCHVSLSYTGFEAASSRPANLVDLDRLFTLVGPSRRVIILDIRGSYAPGNDAAAQFSVKVGSQDFRLTVQPKFDDPDFMLRVESTLAADSDETPVIIALTPPPGSAENQALLAVDSVDVSLVNEGICERPKQQ
jgi:hypothetical protein